VIAPPARRAPASRTLLRLVALGGGNEVLFHQQLLAFEVALELGQVGLGAHHFGLLHALRGAGGFDVGLRLAHAVLEGFRVDAGDQLVQTSPAS
jgi:hypothetical protein